MDCHENETIRAIVTRVCPCHLMVCACKTGQEIHVHTDQARCFCCRDCVCIAYSGAMTMSIPPQITACSITKLACGC